MTVLRRLAERHSHRERLEQEIVRVFDRRHFERTAKAGKLPLANLLRLRVLVLNVVVREKLALGVIFRLKHLHRGFQNGAAAGRSRYHVGRLDFHLVCAVRQFGVIRLRRVVLGGVKRRSKSRHVLVPRVGGVVNARIKILRETQWVEGTHR
ncbi:hypothetical protein D3C80_1124470 [compost metagenome]